MLHPKHKHFGSQTIHKRTTENDNITTMPTSIARRIRRDSLGSPPPDAHTTSTTTRPIESLTYEQYESDVFFAHEALEHYYHRGSFWNSEKHDIMIRYLYKFS